MPTESTTHFDEQHLLHVLKHYLPSQGPLKDFVHHNTLHAFQDMQFYDAIFKAQTMFGFQTTFSLAEYRDLYKIGRITSAIVDAVVIERKGKNHLPEWRTKLLNGGYDETIEPRVGRLRREWANHYPIDLDNAVQPLLFRIVASYIDQGIAVTPFPYEDKGLLAAVRLLEQHSATSFFATDTARKLLHAKNTTIQSLLERIVGKKRTLYYEQYIYDQQFAHRGWSGLVSTLEDKPEALMYSKKVSLRDMIVLELVLEIDALTDRLGKDWLPLGELATEPPVDLLVDEPFDDLQEVLRLWQDAFEWAYYDTVLEGVLETAPSKGAEKSLKKSPESFQAIFCIDDREYSLRTHIEQIDPKCETLGSPGFFGVEFYFHPAHAKFYDKLCPAPMTPNYLVKEIETTEHAPHGKEIIYTKHSHRLARGFLASYLLGIPALGKLVLNLVNPTMSPAIADAFSHMNPAAELTIVHTGEFDKDGLQIGFTILEMADRVEKTLRCIGLARDFASIVYVMGHGSSSANNPHHGAHDCGACNGRPGLVNARVFAAMANRADVRAELARRGVAIPESTQFVGALHDTASDEVLFYDEHVLSTDNAERHAINKQSFESALDLNAKERSRRFKSIGTTQDIKKIRRDIKKRSVSYFEPRPELGHGTNALCIIGRRDLTKRLFLDRRAFLNSYDYTTDPEGKLLVSVITPLAGVCGGINLEYFFSRMDNYKLGAGTKLPHNVMGLVGVANSSDGDLRSGLPLQMVEVHDPVRLLMIVEHYPEVVEKVIKSDPSLYEWFEKGWINLVAYHPDEQRHYVWRGDSFVPYTTLAHDLPVVKDLSRRFETAGKMKTNRLLDATQENLPVHIIK
ncbi:DUF2309 domain-containing protein [Candidatus Saccharibacteria bacterium]|nr:DUF2309 domain-containing protein [Candidatus Saccharibacteria bacterium]